MRKVIMIGCDLHDGSMLLRIAVGAGVAETLLIKNSRQGRKAMIAQLLRRAMAIGGARIVFAYEASGQGFGLHDELIEAGIECYVLAPTKIARSQRQRSQKTDEKDAQQLLELLRRTSWRATRCRRYGFRMCKPVTTGNWCGCVWTRGRRSPR